ncbi:MAG TPA: hypothetical protein VIS10_07105 [Anaerolineales bacterium]
MSNNGNEQAGGNWKSKALLAGAVLGAVVGLSAAYLIIQRAEREDGEVRISPGDGVKLGVLVFGLLRQVAQLGEGEK